MPVKYVQMITREMVQSEPGAVFVFGDNLGRAGLGGQAGAMRGEPNTIGVATKRAPGMADDDFFADTAECRDILLAEIKQIANALDAGKTVYVPAAGLGTGLSELPKRAPKLAQLLVDSFRRFPGDPCPWPNVIGVDDRGLIAIKGFDKALICNPDRGIRTQYEIGKTYELDGNIAACKRGYHACLYPLDVFNYYPPASGRFAEVVLGGQVGFHDEDTKAAAARITISAEIKIPEMVSRAVKWITDRAFPEGPSATGDYGAASATGDYGAASATGDYGAASATGVKGAASATGYYGAASATGFYGKARGKDGNALFLVRRRDDYSDRHGEILHAWAGIVGRDGIKPDTWYTLDVDGKPTEVVGE